MNNKTTVQQLIDILQRVPDKSRIVWLEIKDFITCEDTPICNGGGKLHAYTVNTRAMRDILFLSEVHPSKTYEEDEPYTTY